MGMNEICGNYRCFDKVWTGTQRIEVNVSTNPTPRNSARRHSESREDESTVERNMQEYHRARQKDDLTGKGKRADVAMGKIGKDMIKTTDRQSRGKPPTSS